MDQFKDTPEDITEDEIDEEFLNSDEMQLFRELYAAMLWDIENKDNDDYEVNKPQMAKLIHAYQFFKAIADRDHGTVEPFDITPKMVHSGITAYFRVFYMALDEMKEFAKIVGYMSSLSLDATVDGEVCISFNIPNVFKPKQK